MLKSKNFPDKKISKLVKKTLEKNNFTFTRCNGHAIFTHSPSGGMFPVSLSKKTGGQSGLSGDKYTIKLIKQFEEKKGCVFIE